MAYFLTSGPMKAAYLKTVICDAIAKLAKIGLRPRVLICDQGSNNRSMVEKLLKVTIEEPFFTVENQKIYCLYDPPHLLKNVRNNLKKKSFYVEGKQITWSHIRDFFFKDATQSGPLRYAPCLTEKHINLPPFASLRVCLAVQVFSHSVAVGIAAMVESGELPPEAIETAKFLEQFDKLFNCFNSSTVKSHSQMKHAWGRKTGHEVFLQECYAWLDKLVYDGKKLPCIDGWKMTIKASLSLWKDLKESNQIKFLLTGRLNQDSLENLFGQIRGKGRFQQNPNAKDFRAAYRQVMVEALLAKSAMTNCKDDIDVFLLRLSNINRKEKPDTDLGNNDSLLTIGSTLADNVLPNNIRELMTVFEDTDNGLSMKDNDVLFYISGYIARKISGRLPACQDHLVSEANPTLQEATLFELKRFDTISDSSKGLVTPADYLYQIVQLLELEYRQHYLHFLHGDKVFRRL